MPLQMRYFLETLGPTMGGLSHSCCQWYKKRQMLQNGKKKKNVSHSFILLSSIGYLTHTDTSHTMRRHGILWTGCTDQQGKCPPISLRINGLLRKRSSSPPENCSTPKLTSFNVHWGVLNLIRVAEIYLSFFLILYFCLRLGLQINSKLYKQTK